MKNWILIVMLFSSAIVNALPVHNIVNLTLTRAEGTEICPKALEYALVTIEYDLSRGWGEAFLRQISSTPWDLNLHPLGITDSHVFMSNINPTSMLINGETVIFYRIVFELQQDKHPEVMMMVGPEGDCILRSAAFDKKV